MFNCYVLKPLFIYQGFTLEPELLQVGTVWIW